MPKILKKMMNKMLNMKRFILVALVVVMTSVVFAQKPDTVINGIGFKRYGVEVNLPRDVKSISVTLPIPNGNKALRLICDSIIGPNFEYDHFQEQLDAAYLSEKEESSNVDGESDNATDTAEEDSEISEEFEDFDYERTVQVNPIAVYDDFIMYSYYESEFYGGVHPLWGIVSMVFDLHTGKMLDENDIFDCTEENMAAIERELRKKLTEYVGSNVDDYDYTTMLNGNFYFDNKDLTYMYVPYEVVWYAAGEPELKLSKKFLKPYLKKDGPLYKFWFGN